MDKSHVMAALFRKYCHLMGERIRYPERVDAITQDLEHVEAVIRMFRPDADLTKLRPIKPNKGCRWKVRGFAIRTAIDILKTSPEPLTTRQLAEMVMERAGMAKDSYKQIHDSQISLHMALLAREANGSVRREGSPIRWSLR